MNCVALKIIICSVYITKYTVICCWKNMRIFRNAKDSHTFPTKNVSIFVIFVYILN